MPKHHPSRVPSRRSPSRVVHVVSSSLLYKQTPLMSGPYTSADRLEPTTTTKAADPLLQPHIPHKATRNEARGIGRSVQMALPQEISGRSQRHIGRSLTMLIVSKLVPPENLASVNPDHMARELYDPSLPPRCDANVVLAGMSVRPSRRLSVTGWEWLCQACPFF